MHSGHTGNGRGERPCERKRVEDHEVGAAHPTHQVVDLLLRADLGKQPRYEVREYPIDRQTVAGCATGAPRQLSPPDAHVGSRLHRMDSCGLGSRAHLGRGRHHDVIVSVDEGARQREHRIHVSERRRRGEHDAHGVYAGRMF